MDRKLELADQFENIRNQLKSELKLDDKVGIFLTPSGSDAEYIPVLIARLLNQDKQLVNIISCNEEVGSGTLQAAAAKYFSDLEPIKGYVDDVQVDMDLQKLADNLEVYSIDARDRNGQVINSSQKIVDYLKNNDDGNVPIVHQVLGSKTGIQEKLSTGFIDYIQKEKGGYLVADACQGRLMNNQYMELMDQGVMVLFTGSKFYRGPPFSGAVLVPPVIMEQLEQLDHRLAAKDKYVKQLLIKQV